MARGYFAVIVNDAFHFPAQLVSGFELSWNRIPVSHCPRGEELGLSPLKIITPLTELPEAGVSATASVSIHRLGCALQYVISYPPV